jgi:hypothetical protein
MMSKRANGDGAIDARGDGVYRLRYTLNGKRFTKTLHNTTLTKARKELRGILDSADKGEHVEPKKKKLREWIDDWIAIGAPGRLKKAVSQRILEGYEEKLRVHVVPVLGDRPLQQLRATEFDKLYTGLRARFHRGRRATFTRFLIRASTPPCARKSFHAIRSWTRKRFHRPARVTTALRSTGTSCELCLRTSRKASRAPARSCSRSWPSRP